MNLPKTGLLVRRLLIIILVVLALILGSLFLPARRVSIEGIGRLSVGQEVAYASPDWLSGWTYRRAITLTPATSVADYQVLVTLDIATMGNPYANVKPDGSDIRFTGSDETTLQDYWIESWDNNGTSKIWVEVKTSGTSTIYMYYGNPTAISASDGNATFLFFDDFSTNTLANYDKAKWVDVHGDGYIAPTYDVANQRVAFDTGDNYASDMYPIGLTVADFLMEVDFWADASYPSNATIALVGRLENPGTSSTHYYLDFSHGNYDSPGITVDSWVNGERSNTVYSEVSDYYWPFTQVHTFRYALFGSTQKFWWNKDVSQPPDISVTDTTHTSAGRLGLVPAQVRGWWDNFRVRRYLEPEPSATVGSEEAACSADISNTSPTGNSYNFGTVSENATYTTGLTYFTVTNNSGGAIDISIQGTDMTNGVTWTLDDGATPGPNTYGLKAGLEGDADCTIIVRKNSPYNNLVENLADSATQNWGLQLLTPTSFSDGVTKSGTVTLTATCR